MANKLGKEYLQRAGADLEMVRDLRRAKTQRREGGQKVILHKFIKEVYPSYKFYKVHAELAKQLQRVIDGDCRRLIIQIPPRSGKLCADETPVLTLNGWKTHGELCVGDYVFSPSGAPVRVKAVSGKAEAKWKVTLSNNDKIWCHDNHEWTVEIVSKKKEVVAIITEETNQLAKRKLVYGSEDGPGSGYALYLPKVSRIYLPDEALPDFENRPRVAITKIEYCEDSLRVGNCIEVDSSDGLYLVGESLNPTHNSLIASKLFPAAYLIAHPDRYVGISSYSAELAEGFSRAARDYYREAGGTFDPSNQSVNDWGTQGGGGLWAAGVGGAITGRSGHCLLIDDPVKNREDADSPRLMKKLWDWYTSTLYTRLEPGVGSIVVTQTRWSENDLIGKLLESEMNVSEKGRENWTILDLPAMSEDAGSRPILPDHCNVLPDWREEPGLALCPQRYDAEDYDRIREAIGTRDFAALYQQRPAPEGGNMFDPTWWQYYEHDSLMPEFQRVMLSVDCTFTDASNSDFVVGTVVGQAGNRYYILDMVRERLDIIGTIAMISRMYNKHNLNGTIIELAASGYAAYQLLSKRVPGLIGFKPERSKTARAAGIVPIVEAGNVFLPASSTWLDAFINEFALFPASKNDDIIDSVGMAINYMSQRSAPVMTEVTWGRGVSALNVPANIVI